LHNFVLIALHFILQPNNHVVYGAVHVGGRTLLVFVTATCIVGTQAANISAAVSTFRSVTGIFVFSVLPGLQQPHVTPFHIADV
jgi:hypothetical protein